MNRPEIFRLLLAGAFCVYALAAVMVWWLPPDWLLASSAVYQLQLGAQGVDAANLTMLQRCSGMLAALPSLAALWLAWRRLTALLRGFEQGQGFTPAAALLYRQFCGWLCAGLILALLEGIWRSLADFMLQPGTTQLTLTLQVSGGDLLAIGVAALFYLLHHLMQQGQQLQQENSEFI